MNINHQCSYKCLDDHIVDMFMSIKIAEHPFQQNIFCAENKILSVFYDMCHVVVRAVSAATDINISGAWQHRMSVSRRAEGPEFIFEADRLDEGIRINMSVKVIKSVDMHAVTAFGGTAG